jgi:DNA end-binding protein Ku
VAVAKFALRGRERLGLLRVKEDALVLHSMHWPDEIRSPAELAPPPVEIGDSEVDGALALMDAMGQDDLSDYHDEYRVALEQVIAAKAEGKAPPTAGVQEPAGQVVDLMAALNESVAKARQSRGEGEHATVHDMPKPKKTAAKKKAPAKKAAAKKTASGRKPRASWFSTPSRPTADRKFLGWIGDYGSPDGARITLYRRGRRAAAGSLAVAPGLSVPPETLRYRSPSKSGLLLAPSPA